MAGIVLCRERAAQNPHLGLSEGQIGIGPLLLALSSQAVFLLSLWHVLLLFK